ncbi:sensor histidine kinase [Marivirga arenosa]|uniref:histidine kinase n=1 Tax=Marivirga arenosa TaxID=3059076 RepID=A0AA51ZVQ7_9BACT|nr:MULTISPECIES: HAMP domain-containing sensor histidine kinase [unclassified Marivirga]WMN06025.1 HAMP domain-containing sensor histidine kinase [Marivirga sp. ABR2-2]WNB17629.1 HAMP domain-containing sensor histidine kinase [Marivirga sp. BKB1-2]
MAYKLENTAEIASELSSDLLFRIMKESSLVETDGIPLKSLNNLLQFISEEFCANEHWVVEESKKDNCLKWDLQNPLVKEIIPFNKELKERKKSPFFTLEISKPFLFYKHHLIFPINLKNKEIYIGFSARKEFELSSEDNKSFFVISERLKELILLVNNERSEKSRSQKLETILDRLPQAIVFTENNNGDTWLNKEALEVFNLEKNQKNISSDLFSKKLADLKVKVTNREEVELVGNNMISLNALPSSFGEDWIWKFENSVLKVIRKNAYIAGKEGELWVFDNVSELYFANERLNSLFRKLNVAYNEINANLTEFQSKSSSKSITDLEAEESRIIQQYDNNDILGKVTHDLRTPFAKVYTIVQLLLTDNQENLSEQQVERINLIKQVVADGLQIVKGFLDTGNMVLDEKKFNPEIIDLQAFVDDSLMPYELLSAKKNIIFITQLLDQNLEIKVDRTYLKRIIDNLISNAIKFSPNETQINYTIFREGDEIIFSVKDQGPGLSDDDKSRLFKKYQQLSAKPIGTDESTGLGLYIVKTMVDKMGGRIWVESEKGKGANFKVALKSNL